MFLWIRLANLSSGEGKHKKKHSIAVQQNANVLPTFCQRLAKNAIGSYSSKGLIPYPVLLPHPAVAEMLPRRFCCISHFPCA